MLRRVQMVAFTDELQLRQKIPPGVPSVTHCNAGHDDCLNLTLSGWDTGVDARAREEDVRWAGLIAAAGGKGCRAFW